MTNSERVALLRATGEEILSGEVVVDDREGQLMVWAADTIATLTRERDSVTATAIRLIGGSMCEQHAAEASKQTFDEFTRTEQGCRRCERAAQPPALPPLPESWVCEQTTWGPFYRTHDTYVGFDGRTPPQGQVSVHAVGPRVSATHVPLADLITVLRHAEQAHQQLKEGK